MANNNGNNGESFITIAIIVITIIMGVATCNSGGSSSRQKQADTLKSGLNKYYSGRSMSKDEYDAVKSYNNCAYPSMFSSIRCVSIPI